MEQHKRQDAFNVFPSKRIKTERYDESTNHAGDGKRSELVTFGEVREYVLSVANLLQPADSTDALPNDLPLLLLNCLTEIENHEKTLCCHPQTSRALEAILGRTSANNDNSLFAVAFLDRLLSGEDIIRVVTDVNASHVFELLLNAAAADIFAVEHNCELEAATTKLEKRNFSSSSDLLLKLADEVILPRFDDLLFDEYGSHVLRTMGAILCGRVSKGRLVREHLSGKSATLDCTAASEVSIAETHKIPAAFLSRFHDLASRVFDWQSISGFLSYKTVSFVLQDFIFLAASVGSNQLEDRFLVPAHQSNNFAYMTRVPVVRRVLIATAMWSDRQASRVWEQIVLHCSETQRKCFVKLIITDNVVALVKDGCANFILQRLLSAIQLEKTAKRTLKLFSPDVLRVILTTKRHGVLTALIELCGRWESLEGKMNKKLQHVFLNSADSVSSSVAPVSSSRMFCCGLLCLKPLSLDETSSESWDVTYAGAVAVQKLLAFKNSTFVCDALVGLPKSTLLHLVCHVYGSRVIEALLTEANVAAGVKHQLIQSLTGAWCVVACDKFGSRLLDRIWADFPVNKRKAIASELYDGMRDLQKNNFGKFICNKWCLRSLQQSVKQWEQYVRQLENQKIICASFVA